MDCDAFFELSIEQRNFGPFYSLLSRLRWSESTQEDIDMINKRVTYPRGPVKEDEFENALLFVGANREAVMHNEAALVAACGSTNVHRGPREAVRSCTHVKLSGKARGGITTTEHANNIS